MASMGGEISGSLLDWADDFLVQLGAAVTGVSAAHFCWEFPMAPIFP